MNQIIDQILKAGGYLLIAGIICFVWQQARDSAASNGFWAATIKGLLWCAAIAFFASISLGNPSCIESETDNRGTTCYEYADDGFEPTTTQRTAHFAYYMTLLYMPAVIGAYKGAKIKNGIE